MKLKLRTLVLTTVTILVALIVGSSLVTIHQVNELGSTIDGFVDGYAPFQRHLQRVRRVTLEQSLLVERAMARDEHDLAEALALSDEVAGALAEADAVLNELEFADDEDRLRRDLAALEQSFEEFRARLQAFAPGDDPDALLDRQQRLGEDVAQVVDELDLLAEEQIAELGLRRAALSGFLVVLLVIGGAVGLGAAVTLTRGIQARLGADPEEVRAIAHRISQGELLKPEEIDSRRRQARGLLLSLRQMETHLYEVIEQIQDSVSRTNQQNRELASASSETAASTQQIDATIRSLQQQTERLSASISEISSAVDEIKANVDGLNKQAENQATAVHQTSSSVEQINASLKNVAETTNSRLASTEQLSGTIGGAREKMEKTESAVQELERNSAAIQEVTTIINDISSQTNLLSMNAAIEAAHAGEEGKGFAVVADEIRKLAQDTAENSRKIGDILKQNGQIVESLLATSQETSTVYGEVETHAHDTMNSFREIAQTMTELANGAGEITEAVAVLNETSSTVQAGSHEIREGIDLIHNTTVQVGESASELKQAVNEISAGSGEINEAMTALNDSANRIGEAMDELSNEVSGFKLGGA